MGFVCVWCVHGSVTITYLVAYSVLSNVSFSRKFPYIIADLANTVCARLDWKLEFKKL